MEREHPPLPRDIADQLLQLPGSDDQFRALFSSDVRSALALLGYESALGLTTYGVPPKAGEPFFCMTTRTLAPRRRSCRHGINCRPI